ncbi:MAG: hypothetical protein NTX22_18435 [Ignavibacteriales bacterium]|nr:hypothetical protein [Ignavibacteriales bacterium]
MFSKLLGLLKTYKLILLIPFFLWESPKLSAQESNATFDKLNFGIGISKIREYSISNFYKPSTGYFGYVSSPFYYGNIQTGVFYFNFKGNELVSPDFKSLYIFLGWGKDIRLPLNITFNSQVRAGPYFTFFKVDSVATEEKNESELALSFNTGINIKMYSNINFKLEADFITIFFHRKIKLFIITAGLNYTINMPLWLKEFLY